jgi:hypothetical protein
LATFGFGLLLLIPLAPALIRLYRVDQCIWGGQDSLNFGCVSLGVSVAIALLVAVCFVITFVAVCFPVGMGVPTIYSQDAMVIAGTVLGLLAGGGVAYVIVRAIFPPHDPRDTGGPRPSPSDED